MSLTRQKACSCVNLPRAWRYIRAGTLGSALIDGINVDFVQSINGKLQKVVLILPCDLFLGEAFTLFRRWWRIGDLCD